MMEWAMRWRRSSQGVTDTSTTANSAVRMRRALQKERKKGRKAHHETDVSLMRQECCCCCCTIVLFDIHSLVPLVLTPFIASWCSWSRACAFYLNWDVNRPTDRPTIMIANPTPLLLLPPPPVVLSLCVCRIYSINFQLQFNSYLIRFAFSSLHFFFV